MARIPPRSLVKTETTGAVTVARFTPVDLLDLDVAQAVWRGEAAHGVNFSGGLHHAMAERACGFCVYNDVAVAIRWRKASDGKLSRNSRATGEFDPLKPPAAASASSNRSSLSR